MLDFSYYGFCCCFSSLYVWHCLVLGSNAIKKTVGNCFWYSLLSCFSFRAWFFKWFYFKEQLWLEWVKINKIFPSDLSKCLLNNTDKWYLLILLSSLHPFNHVALFLLQIMIKNLTKRSYIRGTRHFYLFECNFAFPKSVPWKSKEEFRSSLVGGPKGACV